MLEQACELVADGVTTVDDVLRNVYAPGMDLTDDEDDEAELGGVLHPDRHLDGDGVPGDVVASAVVDSVATDSEVRP